MFTCRVLFCTPSPACAPAILPCTSLRRLRTFLPFYTPDFVTVFDVYYQFPPFHWFYATCIRPVYRSCVYFVLPDYRYHHFDFVSIRLLHFLSLRSAYVPFHRLPTHATVLPRCWPPAVRYIRSFIRLMVPLWSYRFHSTRCFTPPFLPFTVLIVPYHYRFCPFYTRFANHTTVKFFVTFSVSAHTFIRWPFCSAMILFVDFYYYALCLDYIRFTVWAVYLVCPLSCRRLPFSVWSCLRCSHSFDCSFVSFWISLFCFLFHTSFFGFRYYRFHISTFWEDIRFFIHCHILYDRWFCFHF